MAAEKTGLTAIAIGLAVGLLGGAAILGHSLRDIRPSERFVTVRGVAEKQVTADLAIWPLKVRVAGNDLATASQSADAARDKVLAFLQDNGVNPKDIVGRDVHVVDRQAADYAQANAQLRYMVEHTILVRSAEVEKVQKISQMTDKLVAAGVVLSSQGSWDKTSPQFLFTQLNAIKPGMMAEATKSAREAATQFAADSGSKVGAIRRASQGLFSIADRDRVGPEGGEGGVGPASDPNKKVRVVVSVDYFLEK